MEFFKWKKKQIKVYLQYLFLSFTWIFNMKAQRTQHRQLINLEKEFDRSAIQEVAKTLQHVNRNYFSVAIIGVQNSGKSTLLNNLFGTNFDVLKGVEGNRTTTGIWLSLDKAQNIMVLDVEGNDSMDRSEEKEYEKMVASYALMTANVLIINIWLKSLGGHTGSQYKILKIIMQICISQFKQDNPKTIVYCVRDFNEQYDNEYQIKSKITRDVDDIWEKIEKPAEFQKYEGSTDKFFKIEVVVLRRYREKYPANFLEDVNKLRERFVDPNNEDYIFAKQKIQYNLPISDLPQLSENAWNLIKTNKKLNLPNEKEQLANFRCSSIVNELQTKFHEEIQTLEKSPFVNFGELKQKYISEYNEKTYQYGKQVVESKKNEMKQTLDDDIKRVIIEKLNRKCRNFEEQFISQSKKQEYNPQKSLQQGLKQIVNEKIQNLLSFMKSMNYQIPNRKEKIDELTKTLKEHLEQFKKDILANAKNQFENQSSRILRLLSSQLLKEHFGQNFWVVSLKIFRAKSSELINAFREKHIWITGEELGAVPYDNMQQKIQHQFKQSIRNQLVKTLIGRVYDYFLEKLQKDEDGNKLNFTVLTEEEIGRHFDKTRDQIKVLIRKLNEYKASQVRRSSLMDDMEEDYNLFESTWLTTTVEEIDKKMIKEYEQIIRRKKQREMKGIPKWLFFFIIFFVYDDLLFSREENPIMFFMVLVPFVLVLLFFILGQGNVVREAVRIVIDNLKDKIPFLNRLL